MSDETVVVRRHWDDWRRATVRRSSLGGLRMDRGSVSRDNQDDEPYCRT